MFEQAFRNIDDAPRKKVGCATEISNLYEAEIRNTSNAGRNGGEYYTPRPLIAALDALEKSPLHQALSGRLRGDRPESELEEVAP